MSSTKKYIMSQPLWISASFKMTYISGIRIIWFSKYEKAHKAGADAFVSYSIQL